MSLKFEKIMVVDDDPLIRRMLVGALQKHEIPVLAVTTFQQALDQQKQEPADLIIADLQLPDGNGLDLMKKIQTFGSSVDIIIMTGFGTIESAVEAMKLGASNYLLKPFTSAQLDVALSQINEQHKLKTENSYLREQLAAESDGGEFLRSSPEMEHVNSLIERVASTNATVLIQGESGTGKEVISRLIYENSLRKDKPYIKVNCAAVPENLLESEFFGHEKGAFTGATMRREGRFELANGGTLLLDEITEISLTLQAKLLRVLQEQEFERVGGNRTLRVDVRIIATTNRDLAKAVEAKEFRQDLYFRLNVVPLKLPALRERKGEVEYLLDCFLRRFANLHNKPVPKVSPLALQQLAAYEWPGNVRELRNYAERAVILSTGDKELEYHDIVMSSPPSGDSVFQSSGAFPTLAEVEERLINLALKQTNGNRNEAAKLVGINVRTLRNKLREYESEKPASSSSQPPTSSGQQAELQLN